MNGIFITGTDTDCGKTEISLAVMEGLKQHGLGVLGIKPVASGCHRTPAGLRNNDALRLQAHGSSELPYHLVNAYAFEPPMAPHIAAGQTGVEIELEEIKTAAERAAAECDYLVIEGVGGWRVPLGPALSISDLPLALSLPVVLVAGIRLGCINHSLLTFESIEASGAQVVGWIANQMDPDMLARDENLATLGALIQAPCLGVVPWIPAPSAPLIAEHLDLTPLLANRLQLLPGGHE